MKTVWNQRLIIAHTQEIEVPNGAEFLCVGAYYDMAICVWFRCDTQQSKEWRTIIVCRTGDEAPKPQDARYLGTVTLRNGDVVYHAFLLERG